MRWFILSILIVGCGPENERDIPDGGIVEECHELNFDKVGQTPECYDAGTPKATTEKRGS